MAGLRPRGRAHRRRRLAHPLGRGRGDRVGVRCRAERCTDRGVGSADRGLARRVHFRAARSRWGHRTRADRGRNAREALRLSRRSGLCRALAERSAILTGNGTVARDRSRIVSCLRLECPGSDVYALAPPRGVCRTRQRDDVSLSRPVPRLFAASLALEGCRSVPPRTTRFGGPGRSRRTAGCGAASPRRGRRPRGGRSHVARSSFESDL